jgi:hypothetical protein
MKNLKHAAAPIQAWVYPFMSTKAQSILCYCPFNSVH